ncbi:hypothetical protein V6N13_051297 [Hibiscus sabdariffa]
MVSTQGGGETVGDGHACHERSKMHSTPTVIGNKDLKAEVQGSAKNPSLANQLMKTAPSLEVGCIHAATNAFKMHFLFFLGI